MRPNCCHISLAFLLKFLNFLQAFVGVSILLYSIWMSSQWNHHIPHPPLPHSSSSLTIDPSLLSAQIAVDALPSFQDAFGIHFCSIKLPAPWFIYAFMGVGVLVCCITFMGCIAAEMMNGCCLCFYTSLIMVLVLLEAALVGFIAIDHHWDEDLPLDPTGQLEGLWSFIEDNVDICKWVGIAVLVVQALSLLVALILRATVSARRREDFDFDFEYEYDVRGRDREPLLIPQSGQSSVLTKGDISGNDIWSSRMREKYGLNNGDKYSYQA